MGKIRLIIAATCFALAGLTGCAPEVPPEEVSSPQSGEEAKQQMELEMQKMQEEMQQQRQRQPGRRGPR